ERSRGARLRAERHSGLRSAKASRYILRCRYDALSDRANGSERAAPPDDLRPQPRALEELHLARERHVTILASPGTQQRRRLVPRVRRAQVRDPGAALVRSQLTCRRRIAVGGHERTAGAKAEAHAREQPQ